MTFDAILDLAGQLAPAFATTLWLSGVSLVITTGVSLLLAIGLNARFPPVVWLVEASVNIPMVIKLFVCFYLLRMEPEWCAVTAIVMHQSAFAASILAGGLREIPKEYEDAALVTGLPLLPTFFLVRLPVAARMVAPALVLQSVEIVKNTSVASLIGILDLTASVEAFQNRTFAYTLGFLCTAFGYAILTLPLMGLGRFWERKLAEGTKL